MRFWLHNQLAGLAICATRLFHSACQSILQSIFQNTGHHEQMSNTQTSSRSQTNVKLNFQIFPSQATTCAPQRNFYATVYLMDCCNTEISTVLFIPYHCDQLQFGKCFLWSSEVIQHNTATQWPGKFFPLWLFHEKKISLQTVLTLPWQTNVSF